MKKPQPKKAKKAVAVKKIAVNSSVAKKIKKSSKNSDADERLKKMEKRAETIANEMINVACKYAEKWKTTSDVGFVVMYGQEQGDHILDANTLKDSFEQQKNNLVECVKNGGVGTKGRLKGHEFNLDEGDEENTIRKIFLIAIGRFGIAVATPEMESLLVENLFSNKQQRDFNCKNPEELGKGGISSHIEAFAAFSHKNLKHVYWQSIDRWEMLFQKLDEAAGLTKSKKGKSLIELDDDFFEIENDSEDIPDVDGAEEGALKYREHLIRERNRFLIQKKKEMATSLSCEVCGFDFEEKYGDLGKDYCEVHHKIPLSSLEKSTKTKLKDLAIVCSNCHRMLHRKRNEILSIDDLRKKIKNKEL